ncbi:MAG: hypothetical protein KKE73_10815 [Proteobacteria bacterium]|nr:hypothetical protein [Pseudomonadota bacterium]
MAKAPAFQFYVKDWLADPAVRLCSHATRGIWIDCLCLMWESEERGKLTGTPEQLARVLSLSSPDFEMFLVEVEDTNVATVTRRNKKITLVNRRMEREESVRISNAERQKKYRNAKNNGDSNTEVTPLSSSSSSSPKKTTCSPSFENGIGNLEFEQWFDGYPEGLNFKKDARHKTLAFEQWNIVCRELGGLTYQLDRLNEWSESWDWQADGGKYIPTPANYIKKRYWQSRPTNTQKPGPSDDDLKAKARLLWEQIVGSCLSSANKMPTDEVALRVLTRLGGRQRVADNGEFDNRILGKRFVDAYVEDGGGA